MMATSEFGKAFAAARKAGDKTFEFNGKKYTTKTAEDVAGEKKAKYESAQRGRSDMMRDLTKAERDAKTDLSRQKIAEAKAKVTREYGAAGEGPLKATGAKIQSMDTDMMRTAGRTAAKEAGQKRKASFAKGGSIDGIAKRGRTKCKTC
jgi:hypothetical protein